MKPDPKPIPEEALRGHIAVVGQTGAGKTFAIKAAVETILEAERRVCIFDPKGDWWGLKSSADGKRPGFPVTIFGGERADVPMGPDCGAALAEIIASRNLPAIVDVAEFTLGEQQRFAASFFEALYKHNRKPIHLIIDEADVVAPQQPLPDQRVMLHRVDQIVRRGRSRGFRVALITQRPAVLHKNVLSQCPALVAMRLTSAQDRKAIEEWIKGQADLATGKKVLNSLARLQQGEGWLWAPERSILDRRTFPIIRTFDSSRTPDDDEEIPEPEVLAAVDLAGLAEALGPEAEEGETAKPGGAPVADLNAEYRRGCQDGESSGYVAGWIDGYRRALVDTQEKLAHFANDVAHAEIPQPERPDFALDRPAPTQAQPVTKPAAPATKRRSPASTASHAGTNGTLSPGALRMLQTFIAHHPRTLSLKQAAKLSGQSVRSSAFRPNTKELVEGGWIVGLADRYAASDSAVQTYGDGTPPASAEEVTRMWLEKLPPSARRLFEVLRSEPGRWFGKHIAADIAGISRSSSGLGASLRELVEAGLAERSGDDYRLHGDFR